jgi:hypothetical protein
MMKGIYVMNKKRIIGSSLTLFIAAVAVMALVAVGSVTVTPTAVEAGVCFGPISFAATGQGSSCAAAQSSLFNQAAAICDSNCAYAGSCGSGPAVSNEGTCYLASNGKWTIAATISNSCTIDVSGCIGPLPECV